MANKATRKLRNSIRTASKKRQIEVIRDKPVFNYHNDTKGKFVEQRFPTASPNADGLISRSQRRNMAMRVYRNKGPEGGASNTAHEPWIRGEYVRHKNHRYIEYRQPSA